MGNAAKFHKLICKFFPFVSARILELKKLVCAVFGGVADNKIGVNLLYFLFPRSAHGADNSANAAKKQTANNSAANDGLFFFDQLFTVSIKNICDLAVLQGDWCFYDRIRQRKMILVQGDIYRSVFRDLSEFFLNAKIIADNAPFFAGEKPHK